MPRVSAGILPFRRDGGRLEVLIAHMGGPLWASKDAHAWTIVKGEYDPDQETPRQAAAREWAEETGTALPPGELVELGDVRQSSKRVTAYAVEAPDLEPQTFTSNAFEMEWPPRSGRRQSFPEVDHAEWVDADQAPARLVKAQAAFVARLRDRVDGGP